MTATEQNIEGTEDQGVILVSEFPPPPYYFRYAEASPGAIPTDGSKKKKSSSMSSGEDEKVSPEIWGGLTPPIIPTDAFLRLSRKVALTAAAAKEDVEKNRINASLDTPLDFSTNSEVEGITLDDRSDALDGITPDQRDKAPNVDSSEDKDLVAVFGEYVEVDTLRCFSKKNSPRLIHNLLLSYLSNPMCYQPSHIERILCLCNWMMIAKSHLKSVMK